jgi:hypothetical protein
VETVLLMLVFITATVVILYLYSAYDRNRRRLDLKRQAANRFRMQAEHRMGCLRKTNENLRRRLADIHGRLIDMELRDGNA